MRDEAPEGSNATAGPAAEPLGRLLFEIGPSRDNIAMRVVASLLGLTCLWWVTRRSDSLLMWALYLLALALAVATVVAATRRRVRVHEQGLAVRSDRGERALSFAEVESLTFTKMVRYTNGIYAGTTLDLVMVGASGRRIDYSTTLGRDGDGFDVVRDRASVQVASKLTERFQREGRALWVRRLWLASFPGIWLAREGLVVGGRHERILPWADITATWKEGRLEIVAAGQPKSKVILFSSWENFFPGYLVFSTLLEARDALSGRPRPSSP